MELFSRPHPYRPVSFLFKVPLRHVGGPYIVLDSDTSDRALLDVEFPYLVNEARHSYCRRSESLGSGDCRSNAAPDELKGDAEAMRRLALRAIGELAVLFETFDQPQVAAHAAGPAVAGLGSVDFHPLRYTPLGSHCAPFYGLEAPGSSWREDRSLFLYPTSA